MFGATGKIIRRLLKALSGHVLADAEGRLRVLESSGADWTVVHGPRLAEKAGTGQYRVGWAGVDPSTQISRDDLADVIVSQVEGDTRVLQLPFVSA